VPNKNLSALLVFVLTAIFYIYSLLPSLAWGDGTKLQSEAISGESFVLAEMPANEFTPDPFIFSKVGVAAWDHPLYIVIGHLLVKALPFFDSLWLVNLMSAIFGAASVTLVFLLSYRFTESLLAACYASFSLALSHTFWWHSSTPEVYTLLVFLLLISFYLFDRYERKSNTSLHSSRQQDATEDGDKSTYTRFLKNSNTPLFFSAFFLGLAASNHVLAFLIMLALGLYYLSSGSLRNFRISNLKKLIMPVIAFLIGFSLYILQFIRMSANFPLTEIMGPAVGSTFLSQLGTLSPLLLGQSILTYLFFLTVQFGPVGLILGGFGIRKISQNKDVKLRKVIFSFIVFALFGIFYRVTDQFTFFITSYIFWAMLMGIGSNYASNLLPPKRRYLFWGILGLLLLATPFFYMSLPRLTEQIGINDDFIGIPKIGTGVRNGLAYYINPYQRGDTSAYEFGEETLSSLPPNSVVLAEWYTDTDEYFILRYFTKIKKSRSDVTVVGWADQDPFYFDSQLTLDMIEDSLPEHPVYLASLSDKFYATSKLIKTYCIVPENNLYRLYQKENSASQCLGSDSVTE
jgi:hypothetical protein